MGDGRDRGDRDADRGDVRRPGRTWRVAAALRTLAARLSEEIPHAVERGLARMRSEVPGFFARDADPDFVALYRDSYVEQLRAICAGLVLRPPLDAQPLSPTVAAEVRAAASMGIPLGDFLRVCRIGHRVLLDDAIALADATVADRDLLVAVVRAASDWIFAWFDWLTARETEAYERERDLLVRDHARRRAQLVRALLDGEPVDGGRLGHELRRMHLAVVAWGEQAERSLCDLREATGLELIDVAGTGATAWGWLSGERIEQRELRAVRAFAPPDGTWLAVGGPAAGVDGFRASHRQALSAYRLARERPAPVTLHADVALLALTLQDPSLAREFVARELGPARAGRRARRRPARDARRLFRRRSERRLGRGGARRPQPHRALPPALDRGAPRPPDRRSPRGARRRAAAAAGGGGRGLRRRRSLGRRGRLRRSCFR